MLGVATYDPMMLLILLNRRKFRACILDKTATTEKVSELASQISNEEERVIVFFVDGLAMLSKMKEEIKKYDIFADYRIVVIDSVDALSKIKDIDLLDVFKDNKIIRITPEVFNDLLMKTKPGIEENRVVKEEPVGKGQFEERLEKLLATVEAPEEVESLKTKILNYCISRKNKRQLFISVRQALVFGLNEKMFEDFMLFLDGKYGKELASACD